MIVENKQYTKLNLWIYLYQLTETSQNYAVLLRLQTS